MIRRLLRRVWPEAHMWSQDLKRDEDSSPRDRARWFYKRGAFWTHEDSHAGWELSWEALIPGGCHVDLKYGIDREDGHGVVIGVGLATLYLHLRPPHWKWDVQEREWSLRIHDQAIWWRIGHDDTTWGKEDPRWRCGSWYPLDTILGRRVYTNVEEPPVPVRIPMPEGVYTGTATVEHSEWKRPRWPGRLVRAGVTVDIPNGIPFPGKGENSWDCGDDALFSLSCTASTVEEAIGRVVGTVLQDRQRNGGPDWTPPARKTS